MSNTPPEQAAAPAADEPVIEVADDQVRVSIQSGRDIARANAVICDVKGKHGLTISKGIRGRLRYRRGLVIYQALFTLNWASANDVPHRASSTASMASSILEYRTVQGRTFHSERHNTEYFTPNDEQQLESVDIT